VNGKGHCVPFGVPVVWMVPSNHSKAIPLQARSGPKGSRKLRFPDFMTTAQDGGKVLATTVLTIISVWCPLFKMICP